MKLISIWMLAMLTSCTLSFQNVSTNGKASDVVDDQLEASADIKADLPAI